MSTNRGSGFLLGITAGALTALLAGGIALYVLDASQVVAFTVLDGPGLDRALAWASRNLGLSLPVFAVVGVLFAVSLANLRSRLRECQPVDRIAQVDHLSDIWISMFFGVGVIWTAIGMRGALLYALGNPDAIMQAGAFAVLQRLVEGGILTALSTTIFGGIGGYLMRVVKTVTTGAAIKRHYERASRQQGEEIQALLKAIEQRLASPAAREDRAA